MIDGTAVVLVSASDDIGIVEVALQIDGATAGTVNAEPYMFTWDTAASGDGTHTLVASATDTDGNVATSATVTVTVQAGASNHAPVAVTASLNATEDTILSTSIVTSASDQDADLLTFTVVATPTKGTLTLAANGDVTFVPTANANGADSFTYKVNDGLADSNVATIDITIAPINDIPVGMAASVMSDEDVPYNGTVTATDADLTTPTYSLYSTPVNTLGTVVINANGSFTYTPKPNVSGSDWFTFRAYDGTAFSTPTMITVTINPVNDAPSAPSFTLDSLDGPTPVTLGTDIDGDPLTAQVLSGPSSGTFTGTGNAYAYTPTTPTLGATDTITYQVSDGTATSTTGTISVIVAGAVLEYGTSAFDWGYAIAEDTSGNVFVVGKTAGAFPTFTSGGNDDAFVRKYDSSWNVVWTRQLGGTTYDNLNAITVTAAGVFVGGQVDGNALLRKYDTDGNIVWSATFSGSISDVKVDGSGNVYIAGSTSGTVPASGGLFVGVGVALVRKYDSTGAFVWENKAASSYWESGTSIMVSASGDVYSAGITSSYWNGAAGFGPSYKHWVRKHAAATGVRLWERLVDFSSTDVRSPAAVTDANGNVFLSGETPILLAGSAMFGGRDAYVRKYNSSGTVQWTTQFGTTGNDDATSIALGASGTIYAAGRTYGAFANKANLGQADVYVIKLDSTGAQQWVRQFGTDSFDDVFGLELGAAGNLYMCGHAFGTLPGETNLGAYDAFFMKLLQ